MSSLRCLPNILLHLSGTFWIFVTNFLRHLKQFETIWNILFQMFHLDPLKLGTKFVSNLFHLEPSSQLFILLYYFVTIYDAMYDYINWMIFRAPNLFHLFHFCFIWSPGFSDSETFMKKVIITNCFSCKIDLRALCSGGWKKTGFSKSVWLFLKLDIYKCPKIKTKNTFKPRKVADFSHL